MVGTESLRVRGRCARIHPNDFGGFRQCGESIRFGASQQPGYWRISWGALVYSAAAGAAAIRGSLFRRGRDASPQSGRSELEKPSRKATWARELDFIFD